MLGDKPDFLQDQIFQEAMTSQYLDLHMIAPETVSLDIKNASSNEIQTATTRSKLGVHNDMLHNPFSLWPDPQILQRTLSYHISGPTYPLQTPFSRGTKVFFQGRAADTFSLRGNPRT